ncbi:AMP-binding enzyme [Hirsutella rhossiliensis]|uniref:AMP-binding enzyme domain-containing protein n=1 Tax=Hirsutella rhossiliensis TaxID=111463 RepID=A0A9P8SEZ6_9HYPO|nr:AMP-binding enzyme domain-containing protein [Hirsutella rhossiliensis]KAH0960211.1 AMP-binding enzyme domain-containing protein [Hirsutella rhossiliensis]
MIYGTENQLTVPNVDLLTLLFGSQDSEHSNSGEHTALHAEAHDPLQVITKARARDLTRQFAYFFRHSYGIGGEQDDDVVVVVSTGQSALACLFFGVIAAEGIYSAASPSSTPEDIARQMRDGPGRVLVCSADRKAIALAAAAEVGLPERNVLVLESYPRVALQSADGAVRCDFRGSLPWTAITDPRELEDRTICILYSSGTTGLPKGVLISHANIVSEAFIPASVNRPIYDKLCREGKGFARRTLAHLPTAHIAGVQGYFITPMFEGGIVYWMPTFKLDDFIRYVPELGITSLFSVPPIYAAIAKHPAITDQFACIRQAAGGAAPLSREIQQAASDKIAPGYIVGQVYGMTETTGAITYTPLGRTDTIGSLSPLLPNMTLRIVDDDDKDVPSGQPGEALVKGPVVTKGYHNRPEANKTAFLADGWFRTGDVLRVEKGLLYLVDRKKELIKYKGLQVAPAELEGVLMAHPSVADAAVIGLMQGSEEVPRAYVVLAPAVRGKTSEADLVAYVKSKVAAYKQLRGGVVLVDAVPRSPAGKILRNELREMQRRQLQGQSRL